MQTFESTFNYHETIQLPFPLALKVTSYRAMYAYGNYIHLKSIKTNLVIAHFRIVPTFITMCKSSEQINNLVKIELEYVEWVEEFLELDYGATCVIVLFFNWVKANYKMVRATLKQYEYGFTLMIFIQILPFSKDFLAFPIHLEQVFFFDDPCEVG
jgi:ABC-type maltose transport system permease subunit